MQNSSAHLDRSLLLTLLDDIGADLTAKGVQAEIAIFGGAAMILSFPDAGGETLAKRESTRDVDMVVAAARNIGATVGSAEKHKMSDAGFLEPEDASQTVAAAADQAGAPYGVEAGWLNDAVAMFASDRGAFVDFGDFPRQLSCETGDAAGRGGLRVTLASPQYIFAMKMLAMRSSLESHDPKDVWNLISACNIDSLDTAERLVARFYPDEILPERTRAIFSDLLEARVAGRDYDPMMGW